MPDTNDSVSSGETNPREPLECFGDPVPTQGRGRNKRTHGPVEIEKKIPANEDEEYWHCPECGWLLKEFMGVHVDDV